MKTKAQKSVEIEEAKKLIGGSKTAVFADFSGVSFEDVKKLKTALKGVSGTYKVVKKRLLREALKQEGVAFDPTQYDLQVGTIFAKGDLSSVASTVYKFAKDLAKEKRDFKVLGSYDLEGKEALDAAQFTAIAKLPGREVLLGQLVGMLTAPIRQFMFVIDQLSKRGPASAEATVEKPVVAEEVKVETPTVEPTN